jgi:hypothetical protein
MYGGAYIDGGTGSCATVRNYLKLFLHPSFLNTDLSPRVQLAELALREGVVPPPERGRLEALVDVLGVLEDAVVVEDAAVVG